MRRKIHQQLASGQAIVRLSLIAALVGAASGGLIVLFRWVVELGLSYLSPHHNNALLTDIYTFYAPNIAALLMAGIVIFLPLKAHQTGVAHVILRLFNYAGRLPGINIVVQFILAAIALIGGFSVGREGPSIHLGAGISSIIGQQMQLPNNCLRVLVGCGVASGISASFDTPLAGVVFAMEVVIMEYTISGFTPVIVSSVIGALVSRIAFGHDIAFDVPPLSLNSLNEIPVLISLSLVISALAFIFVRLIKWFTYQLPQIHLATRLLIGGLGMGICAWMIPSTMGIGYDQVNAILLGDIGLHALLLLMFGKLIASAWSLGWGVPGGIIGPTLVIGAAAGGSVGVLANSWFPELQINSGFYAMVGMGALMSACLNAPLASLVAVFELTANPNIIWPAMGVIVVANLITRSILPERSVFQMVLYRWNTPVILNPIKQALNKIGVVAVMTTDFDVISASEAENFIPERKTFVVNDIGIPMYLMIDQDAAQTRLAAIQCSKTLDEVLAIFNEDKMDIGYIYDQTHSDIIGVITRADIEHFQQVPESEESRYILN
tara:strand:- start:368 stop:2017 length:1650 start_codon:yes stop_codon:yes gene_type:complete